MHSLRKSGGKEHQSGLQGKSFAGSPGHGTGHTPTNPGPNGSRHPRTGEQHEHYHSGSGTSGEAHCFPGRRR